MQGVAEWKAMSSLSEIKRKIIKLVLDTRDKYIVWIKKKFKMLNK